MKKLSKHIGIICSTGRTGTSFFAKVLSTVIEGAFSVHEPDVWDGITTKTLDRIRRFGPYHMVVGRLLGKTGLRNLSQSFIDGRLSMDQLSEAIRSHRFSYYQSIDAELIVEANGQWFGILPALPHVFENYRVVGIIRDPRFWLSSTLNFGHVYGPKDWVMHLGFRRLDPMMTGDVKYLERWPDMDRFEKACWTWRGINTILDKDIGADPDGKMYRFEDLFLGPNRQHVVDDALSFLTRFPDRKFDFDFPESLLSNRIHSVPRASFPDWHEWNRTQARQLQEICGPLMNKYGYGRETDWIDLVG